MSRECYRKRDTEVVVGDRRFSVSHGSDEALEVVSGLLRGLFGPSLEEGGDE